jgi:hypothetical protein
LQPVGWGFLQAEPVFAPLSQLLPVAGLVPVPLELVPAVAVAEVVTPTPFPFPLPFPLPVLPALTLALPEAEAPTPTPLLLPLPFPAAKATLPADRTRQAVTMTTPSLCSTVLPLSFLSVDLGRGVLVQIACLCERLSGGTSVKTHISVCLI